MTATNVRPRQSQAAVRASVLCFMVIMLDAVAVNLALPSIQQSVGGGIAGSQWVVDGYTLMFAALLLTTGALSDRIGARSALRLGVNLFLVTSLVCAAAPTLGVLISARLLQGAAAAVVLPASLALISDNSTDSSGQRRAVVKWALGGGVAVASGPLIGGLLAEVDWRLIFVLNLPAGLVALRVLSRVPPSPRRARPIDPYGQVAATLAMGGLVYAVIEGGHGGLTAPVIAALSLSVVGTVGVAMSTALLPHPVLPRELFASPSFRIALVAGFAFMVGHYGLLFVMSLYLQQNRGLSPAAAGLVFLPMLVIGVALTPFAARGVERFGARALTGCGLLVIAAGLLLLASLPPSAPVWAISLSMMLVGLGGPIVVPPITMVVLDQVPDGLVGIAGGVFNTSRQLGGALSVGVFGAMLAGFDENGSGVRYCLLTGAAVVLLASAASFRLPPERTGTIEAS